MKRFISGILVGAILATSVAVYAESSQTIQAIFGRVKLVVEGKAVDKETLLYNGTTYVPLRAAAEILGMEVGWDEITSTASLSNKNAAQPVKNNEQLPPAEKPAETTAPASPVVTPSSSTITFDNLEITLGTNISFTTIDNRYSDKDGATVVKIPVKIKNLKNETHGLNMFYYTFYGSKGTKVDSADTYFNDSIMYAGDMRSGAEQNTFLHVMYDGDGDYYMEFNNFTSKAEIKFVVKK